ncbi:MAG TPA: hypothetical protein VI669_18685, partial [Vicinamibacteria bacterium]
MSCEFCGGTGFEIVEREGRQYAQPCRCRQKAAASDDSKTAILARCRIPPRYQHCTLGNFDAVKPLHRSA